MPFGQTTPFVRGKPVPKVRLMLSTPHLTNLSHFWLVLALRKPSEFRANKPVTRCLDRRAKCQSGTLLETTGGTQTHSRRTGSKLRQLLCTRQGLVRVPESNTKYGGNPGITGGRLTLPVPPSISESSGIPKRKKLFAARSFELRPAVHRVTIYCGEGVALGRLTRS